jgi:hypothetical protein
MTAVYEDLRVTNTFKASTEILRKILGIVRNHQKHLKLKFEILSKRNHDEDYRSHYIEPLYVDDIPPLLELMKRDEFPEHDQVRFKLLKYIIGSHRLKNYNLELIPTNYLLDVLTLTFLRQEKLIDQFEADLILLTIKHVETKTVPEDLEVAQILDEKALRTSFLYSKFFVKVMHCFEPIGLIKLTVNLNFFDR